MDARPGCLLDFDLADVAAVGIRARIRCEACLSLKPGILLVGHLAGVCGGCDSAKVYPPVRSHHLENSVHELDIG